MTRNLMVINRYNFDNRYIANTKGEVFHSVTKHKYRPYVTRHGYVEFVLTEKDGKKRHCGAHVLVAELFKEKPKDNTKIYHVNHIDGNKENNHLSNLEWVTISENIKHSHTLPNRAKWGSKTK